MRTAICLSGEPRSLNLVHKNLKETFNKYFYHYTIFAFIPKCNTSHQVEECLPDAIIQVREDEDIDDSLIPSNHRLASGPQRFLQQMNGWKGSNMMRKEYELANGVIFDFVIRCRTDVRFTSSLPDLKDLSDHTLYIPSFHCFTGLNDRFCIGSPKVIDNYMDAIDIYYEDPTKLVHAEEFLKYCLQRSKCKIEKLDVRFNRVRENGEECNWDSTDT